MSDAWQAQATHPKNAAEKAGPRQLPYQKHDELFGISWMAQAGDSDKYIPSDKLT